MAMDGLPEGVASPGRVPEQLLETAPILKRRRRNREEIVKKGSATRVFGPKGKYRRKGGQGVDQGVQAASRRGLGWGHAPWPPGRQVGPPGPPSGIWNLPYL